MNKIVVATNAILRAEGLDLVSASDVHFRGRNGYIFALQAEDLRRRRLGTLLAEASAALAQSGLMVTDQAPMTPPPEPPGNNETCIICFDGTIKSAINPQGCRHAFACDRCLSRLHRCAMCQTPRVNFLPFSSLSPAISAESPVYHAIMGNLTGAR